MILIDVMVKNAITIDNVKVISVTIGKHMESTLVVQQENALQLNSIHMEDAQMLIAHLVVSASQTIVKMGNVQIENAKCLMMKKDEMVSNPKIKPNAFLIIL